MQENTYGGPGSYILMTLSLVFGWISKLGMDQIAWIISLVSGTLASISFALRIHADIAVRRQKKQDNERVVEKPQQD